jgi:hypothetical protein
MARDPKYDSSSKFLLTDLKPCDIVRVLEVFSSNLDLHGQPTHP